MSANAFTLADEPTFLAERFGTNSSAKALFKKLISTPNEKLFLMNNTNGTFADDFKAKIVDIHDNDRPAAAQKLLTDHGYDPTKDYTPAAIQQEEKKAAASAKGVDRWAKIVQTNVIGVIFGIKLDTNRGFKGIEDDLKNHFEGKRIGDEALLKQLGVTSPETMKELRKVAIKKAYLSFSERSFIDFSSMSSLDNAITTAIAAAHYKNDYFGIVPGTSSEKEKEEVQAKINALIITTAKGLAMTGGFDEGEMTEEVKEKLPETLNDLFATIERLVG